MPVMSYSTFFVLTLFFFLVCMVSPLCIVLDGIFRPIVLTPHGHEGIHVFRCCSVFPFFFSFSRQEEVYSPLEVTVETENGQLVCRTYQMNNFSACLPSPQYKQVRQLSELQNNTVCYAMYVLKSYVPTSTHIYCTWEVVCSSKRICCALICDVGIW